MASEIIKGLFGFTPQELTQQREASDYAKAMQYAQLDPLQQSSFLGMQGVNTAVRGLGGAAKQLFNIQDPEMQEQSLLEQSAKELYSQGVDPMSTQGLSTLIQRLNAAGARPQTLERLSGALQQAQMNDAKLDTQRAQQGQYQAGAALKLNELQQQQALAAAMAALPADATDEQRMAVLSRFGSPDVQIRGIDYRARLAAEREGRLETIRAQTEAKLEAARQAGANARQLELIRQEGRMDIERMRQEDKKERAQEKKYEGFQKAERAAEGFLDNGQNIMDRLMKIKARVNNKTAGVAGGALSKVWATEAQAVKLELESIGSNIGFDKLTEMRQNSPTGGALGSVSDYEGKQLRNAVASLENTQDPKVLQQNIDSAINTYQKIAERVSKGLEQDRARFRMGQSVTPTPQTFTTKRGTTVEVLPEGQ